MSLPIVIEFPLPHNLGTCCALISPTGVAISHPEVYNAIIADLNDWLIEHVAVENWRMLSFDPRRRLIIFQRVVDLVYFKLRWYDPQ